MAERKQFKYYFGKELAVELAEKIVPVCSGFNKRVFVNEVARHVDDQELKQRVATITTALFKQLPEDYIDAIQVLSQILGPENEKETGMFTEGYWLMPIAFYVEQYGVEYFNESIAFLEELTKRHTGEYAIRPFVTSYPKKTLRVMNKWSRNKNFHVRRLASEGLRPRLPWAKKIDLFSDDPAPVISILENLKSDKSAYVRKSVANNLNDFLKENYKQTMSVLQHWSTDAGEETQWIIKHALRNEIKKNNKAALKLLK